MSPSILPTEKLRNYHPPPAMRWRFTQLDLWPVLKIRHLGLLDLRTVLKKGHVARLGSGGFGNGQAVSFASRFTFWIRAIRYSSSSVPKISSNRPSSFAGRNSFRRDWSRMTLKRPMLDICPSLHISAFGARRLPPQFYLRATQQFGDSG